MLRMGFRNNWLYLSAALMKGLTHERKNMEETEKEPKQLDIYDCIAIAETFETPVLPLHRPELLAIEKVNAVARVDLTEEIPVIEPEIIPAEEVKEIEPAEKEPTVQEQNTTFADSLKSIEGKGWFKVDWLSPAPRDVKAPEMDLNSDGSVEITALPGLGPIEPVKEIPDGRMDVTFTEDGDVKLIPSGNTVTVGDETPTYDLVREQKKTLKTEDLEDFPIMNLDIVEEPLKVQGTSVPAYKLTPKLKEHIMALPRGDCWATEGWQAYEALGRVLLTNSNLDEDDIAELLTNAYTAAKEEVNYEEATFD